MGTSTHDVAATTTMEVPTVSSPSPHVTQATIPLVISSPPSSIFPPSSSSIFSSLMELSPTISSLISQLPSIPTTTSPAVYLPPVSTFLASLLMPPPSVSIHFPSSPAAAPSSTSSPTPLCPVWISQHLSQHKRKVPITPMDFSVIPAKGARKQKLITRFSQSASGEILMEITYPDPSKDKKDLSPTDYMVMQVTMGTSSESLQGEALSTLDSLCKKLQEEKEEKRLLKEQNKHLLQAPQKMGSAPPTTATETLEVLIQDKIKKYAKIGEQGMAVSTWRNQILKDSEE
ncbi:hypothetical protein KI387_024207, partial [Taxus chinensis]